MLIGNFDDDNEFMSHPLAVKRAIDFLQAHDFKEMDEGRYDIDGDLIYAKLERYMTAECPPNFPEAHRRYIDVQYIVEGEEFLGWCPLNPDLKVHTPYDPEKDIELFEGLMPESHFPLTQGSFVILSPKDVHKTHIAIDNKPCKVTKVVVKVATELLK